MLVPFVLGMPNAMLASIPVQNQVILAEIACAGTVSFNPFVPMNSSTAPSISFLHRLGSRRNRCHVALMVVSMCGCMRKESQTMHSESCSANTGSANRWVWIRFASCAV